MFKTIGMLCVVYVSNCLVCSLWCMTVYAVASDTPPVTGDPASGPYDYRGVSVTPLLYTSNTPATHLQPRSLRSYVEGNRIVYVVNENFLEDCVASEASVHQTVYLNIDLTSRFTRGTLKIALGSRDNLTVPAPDNDLTSHFTGGTLKIALGSRDNLTVPAPDNDLTSHFTGGTLKIALGSRDNLTVPAPDNDQLKECKVGIKQTDGVPDDDKLLMKVLTFEFESSPEIYFKVQFHALGTFDPAVRIDKSMEVPRIFVVAHPRFKMIISWRRLPKIASMVVQFTVIDKNDDRIRKVNWTSSVTGFVRTPFWDGVSANTAHVDTWIKFFRVPERLRVMLSWEHLGTGDAENCVVLNVLTFTSSGADTDFRYCGAGIPSPTVLPRDTDTVRLIYRDHNDWGEVDTVFTGYSLRFSFHNANALPQQLADKTWNCSVPHWPDFKQHLQCNLLTECARGEDEADCPYTRGACPRGHVAAGGSCFNFDLLPPSSLTSWAEAEAACRRRGSRLPTLNTPAKWRAVLDLLRHRGWEHIYIGLSSGDPSLTDLYRHFLQWSDSSVAYFVKAAFVVDSQCNLCGFLKKTRRPDFVYMDSCYTNVPGNLLCEHVEEVTSKLRVTAFTAAYPSEGYHFRARRPMDKWNTSWSASGQDCVWLNGQPLDSTVAAPYWKWGAPDNFDGKQNFVGSSGRTPILERLPRQSIWPRLSLA